MVMGNGEKGYRGDAIQQSKDNFVLFKKKPPVIFGLHIPQQSDIKEIFIDIETFFYGIKNVRITNMKYVKSDGYPSFIDIEFVKKAKANDSVEDVLAGTVKPGNWIIYDGKDFYFDMTHYEIDQEYCLHDQNHQRR